MYNISTISLWKFGQCLKGGMFVVVFGIMAMNFFSSLCQNQEKEKGEC
jgi:hypothetical protein